MIDWDNDYKAIISVIEDSTKFLENSMNFKDLDTFVENQRMQCESISLEEKVFKIPFEDLCESGTSKWAKLINTNCKVQIYRLDNPNLFQVKFDWIANSSKTWTHDLRINIYFKKNDGTYVPLNNKPCLMTSSDLSILICNFDISKCQENSELKEEDNEEHKNDKRKFNSQKFLKFKIKVESIDYGLKQIQEKQFFKICKGSLMMNFKEFRDE